MQDWMHMPKFMQAYPRRKKESQNTILRRREAQIIRHCCATLSGRTSLTGLLEWLQNISGMLAVERMRSRQLQAELLLVLEDRGEEV